MVGGTRSKRLKAGPGGTPEGLLSSLCMHYGTRRFNVFARILAHGLVTLKRGWAGVRLPVCEVARGHSGFLGAYLVVRQQSHELLKATSYSEGWWRSAPCFGIWSE